MNGRCCLALVFFAPLFPLWAQAQAPAYHHSGMKVDWQSHLSVKVTSGSLWVNNGLGGEKEIIITTDTIVTINNGMTTLNGINGLAFGEVEENNTWYYLWVIGTRDGRAGYMLSKHRDSTNFSASSRPPGFDFIRRLPIAVYRKSNGYFRPFRTFSNRQPYVEYTEFSTAAEYRALSGGTGDFVDGNSKWSAVDLSQFVPPGAEMASLMIAARYNNVSARSAYIRNPTFPNNQGILVCSSTPQNYYCSGVELRLDLNEAKQLEYRWNGSDHEHGNSLWIFVKGYYWHEAL